MASSYPSSADALSNPASGDALSTGHAAQHANANDAIEAIEATLGLNPQGGSATVKARLDAIEAADWVTSTRILDGTIVNGDINASAAIDPSKIAQNVVTFSNADAVVATSTRKLAQIGTMSASRTVTLPAASGVAAGTELIVADLSGTVTSTNTIVIARAGSDTVNGATSVTIGAAYGWRRFVSDGSSKWGFDGGVLRTSDSGTITSANIADGTIVNADINASAAIDLTKLSASVVTSAGVGNLLLANQASVETDVTGFYNDAPTNGTLTKSNGAALFGTYSVLMTSNQAGAISFRTANSANANNDNTAVTPGVTYTGTWWAKGTCNGSILPRIYWYKSDHSAASTAYTLGTVITPNGSTWTRGIVTALPPADAAYASMGVSWTAAGAAEAVYFDCFGIWPGAGGQWALPGSPIPNLGTYTDESVGRRIFTWDNVNARYQMTYSDTGVRDIAALVTNGWTVDYAICHIRRMGNTVQFTAILNPSASTTAAPLTIPSGFRTAANMILPLMPLSSDIVKPTFLETNGSFTVYGTGRGSVSLYAAGQWATNDAWPSSLPGTASGSIPQ